MSSTQLSEVGLTLVPVASWPPLFKLTGDEPSVEVYHRAVAAHAYAPPTEKPKEEKEEEKTDSQGRRQDWAAFYLQTDEEHARGTDGYRWDRGYPSANLFKVDLTRPAAQESLNGPDGADDDHRAPNGDAIQPPVVAGQGHPERDVHQPRLRHLVKVSGEVMNDQEVSGDAKALIMRRP